MLIKSSLNEGKKKFDFVRKKGIPLPMVSRFFFFEPILNHFHPL